MRVYVLQHEHALGDEATDTKMIGVYAAEADALAARERLSAAPGFRDDPEGFSIDAYDLGRDHWSDGFVAVGGDSGVVRGKTQAA